MILYHRLFWDITTIYFYKRGLQSWQNKTGNREICSIRSRRSWRAARVPPKKMHCAPDLSWKENRILSPLHGLEPSARIRQWFRSPSQHVHAPGIAESPVNIECKVREIKPLGSHSMILADVVGVTIDDTLLDEKGKFELNQSGLVTYSHGEYFLLGKKLGTFGYSVKKEKKRSR